VLWFKLKVQGIVALINVISSSIEIATNDACDLPGFLTWDFKRVHSIHYHPYHRSVDFIKCELDDYTKRLKESVIDMYEETYNEELECE